MEYNKINGGSDMSGKAKEVYASFKPSTFIEGGGLMDNVVVTWKECRAVMWDYNGRIQTPNPALKVALVAEDGQETDQYWSAGSDKEWAPTDDGLKLKSKGSNPGIIKSSNMGLLMKSLLDSGFPEDKMDDKVTTFEGLVAHMVRVPAPERRGLTKSPRADGKTYDATILVVDEIVKLPWEKKEVVAEKKGEDDDLKMKARDLVMELLAENPKGLTKKALAAAAFKRLPKDDPNRTAVFQLLYKDEFLADGMWEFDGNTLKV
jgi:hypothetical protein